MSSFAKQLVLASTSSARRKLLATTGLTFDCVASAVDESAITDPSPQRVALLRSLAKARSVAAQYPQALVLGADQTLEHRGVCLHKVASPAEARSCLKRLAGEAHTLHSAMSLVYGSVTLFSECSSVLMPMRSLTDAEIDAYIATGEWQGCVGCYRFEGAGIHLFSPDIKVDASAVQGLPLPPLLAALRRLGVNGLLKPLPPWSISLPETSRQTQA